MNRTLGFLGPGQHSKLVGHLVPNYPRSEDGRIKRLPFYRYPRFRGVLQSFAASSKFDRCWLIGGRDNEPIACHFLNIGQKCPCPVTIRVLEIEGLLSCQRRRQGRKIPSGGYAPLVSSLKERYASIAPRGQKLHGAGVTRTPKTTFVALQV